MLGEGLRDLLSVSLSAQREAQRQSDSRGLSLLLSVKAEHRWTFPLWQDLELTLTSLWVAITVDVIGVVTVTQDISLVKSLP